jgi:hypothetical protein
MAVNSAGAKHGRRSRPATGCPQGHYRREGLPRVKVTTVTRAATCSEPLRIPSVFDHGQPIVAMPSLD